MSSTIALMLLVPVAGAPLLGNFGVVLANVLTYIAAILTIVSGAEYIIKNFSCISNM
jgi:phosphatidylglycerophosphate synthase